VIVNNLNVISAAIAPDKTDSPLIVDPYTVLSLSVAGESLQSVPRGDAEVIDGRTAIQHPQLPEGGLLNVSRQSPRKLAPEDPLSLTAPETL
jgi:hypothetical protein